MEIKDLKQLENGSVVFEVEEGKEEWEAVLNRISDSMQKQKPVQGYRPGKAPLPIAYKEYGQPLIDQASQEVLNGAVEKVCGEHEYFLLANPEITAVTADLSSLQATVSIVPYPTAPDFVYTGIEVEKPIKTVTDAEVDDAVNRYMKGHPYVHEVEREARMGDTVEVSFTGTCNGEGFEFDHSDKSHFRMGTGALFAGLDDHLLGHMPGDDVEVSLTMPENFHRKPVRGKTLDLKVHLNSITEREVLECTDEFVKEKVKGAETVAEFRELQRTRLQKTNDAKTDKAFDRNLQKALASRVTCPIPDSMVQVGVDGFVRSLRSMASQQGRKAEEILRERGQTMEMFINQVRPIARMQVRVSVALDYIMRKENMVASEEAIEERIQKFMKNSRLPHDKALAHMGGRENVAEKVTQEMAYNFVRDNCKVVETEVDVIPINFGKLE
ncbi:MAG: trigger factor [Lachnospiraceae bacterium]|nr:trigger factor [Lachnospiraceae bacterium]